MTDTCLLYLPTLRAVGPAGMYLRTCMLWWVYTDYIGVLFTVGCMLKAIQRLIINFWRRSNRTHWLNIHPVAMPTDVMWTNHPALLCWCAMTQTPIRILCFSSFTALSAAVAFLLFIVSFSWRGYWMWKASVATCGNGHQAKMSLQPHSHASWWCRPHGLTRMDRFITLTPFNYIRVQMDIYK